MTKISLASSMRTNLLSLQTISKQVSGVQNRLSTGNKVNTAIDNPSSYYTARNLANRAEDLDALLDSMGQAVSTIKAATEGIDSASMMLEQMRAVTEKTLTEAQYIPHQVEFSFDHDVQALLDAGYVEVNSQTSSADLQTLLTTDGAKIVLTEDVSWGSLSPALTGKSITINGGGHTIKTSGLYFYGGDLTFENAKIENNTGTSGSWTRGFYTSGNATIRNVEIVQNGTTNNGQADGIQVLGNATIENVRISLNSSAAQLTGLNIRGTSTVTNVKIELNGTDGAIMAGIGTHSTEVTISDIAVEASGGRGYGVIGPLKNADIATSELGGSASRPESLFNGQANTDAILDYYNTESNPNAAATKAPAVTAAQQYYASTVGAGDDKFGAGTWYLPSIGELIEMYGINPEEMYDGWGSTSGVSSTSVVNEALKTLKANGADAEALTNGYYWSSSEYTNYSSWVLYGASGARGHSFKTNENYVRSFQLLENTFVPLSLSTETSGLGSGEAVPKVGQVMYSNGEWGDAADYDSSGGRAAVGVIVAVGDDGSVKIMGLKDATYTAPGSSTAVSKMQWSTDYVNIPEIDNYTDYELLQAMNPSATVVTVDELNKAFAELDTADFEDTYNQALEQYDMLISDASYKGVNLLKNDTLQVRFNEDASSSVTVAGKSVSSESLGLSLADWAQKEGILESVRQLSSAVASLRSYSSELGNSYSIVTNRQEFTESLINVLTEGADKLTLADMNEESANMLALQTRQQLAINSLSLASQAAQGVLKLF